MLQSLIEPFIKSNLGKNMYQRIIRATLAILATAVIFLSDAAARGDTYIETFDAALNPTLWHLSTGGNDWDVAGGVLTITRTNSGNGRLEFIPQVIGDFDVRFDYTLQWANTSLFGDRIQLSLTSDFPNYSYVVLHGQEGFINGVAVDPFPRYGPSGPNTPSGTMRVTRTGSAVSMQYLNAGNWITLQTGTNNRNMSISLDNYIFNSFTPGSKVVIDNFSITADLFSTSIPEPGASCLLLGGLSFLLARYRRSR